MATPPHVVRICQRCGSQKRKVYLPSELCHPCLIEVRDAYQKTRGVKG
jgi:hypothetical protein